MPKLTEDDVKRSFCLSSSLNFARYFHKAMTGEKFIVSDHHVRIASALDRVVAGEVKRLIITVPPRSGKTAQAVKYFIPYCFAKNPASQFMHLSYSADLAVNNASDAREVMKHEDYRRLFPWVQLSTSTDSKSDYKTKAGGAMHATGTLGPVTGMGAGSMQSVDYLTTRDGTRINVRNPFAGALILDDPIKPEDALSARNRDAVNQRFEHTIKSRINSQSTPIIIIMQRLHEDDLVGYLKRTDPHPQRSLHINIPAIHTDAVTGEERSMWPHRYDIEDLKELRRIDPFVFATQYMQNPVPPEGLMYKEFHTYPPSLLGSMRTIKRGNYTDTADVGSDYLCSICYTVADDKKIYITDVLYTNAPMEITEAQTAKMLRDNDTREARIESNNGGRGFSRKVQELAPRTMVKWFTQTGNKESRVLTNSATVQHNVYFPEDWSRRWPKFYNDLVSFKRDFKSNRHDDAADALSGVVETEYGKNRSQGIHTAAFKLPTKR